AEDGIRDLIVTGVQTCALPICRADRGLAGNQVRGSRRSPPPAEGTRACVDGEPEPDAVTRLRACSAGRVEGCVSPGLMGVEPKRSEEHTSELQSRSDLVCRLLL